MTSSESGRKIILNPKFYSTWLSLKCDSEGRIFSDTQDLRKFTMQKVPLWKSSQSLHPGKKRTKSRKKQWAIQIVIENTQSKNVLYRCLCAQSVWLLAALWTVAFQAPPSIEFSRQKYWGGLPFPPPGVFPAQRSNPCLLNLQVDYFTAEPAGKPCFIGKQWQKKK